MNLKNKTFIGYARVSTQKQAKTGAHETQIMLFNEWEKETGVTLEKIYVDEGEHGWDLSRPEFLQMLEHLKSVDGLVIQNTDRFSRADPIDTLILYRRIFEQGKQIWSIMDGELKMQSLEEFLMMSIQSYTNAKRIETDKSKQIAGIKRKRAEQNGLWGPKKKDFDKEKFKIYRKAGLKKSEIAKLFGMSRATLYRRIIEYGINDMEAVPENFATMVN